MGDKYSINRNIDGHPVCKNGNPINKIDVIEELNKLQNELDLIIEDNKKSAEFLKKAGFLVSKDEYLLSVFVLLACEDMKDYREKLDSIYKISEYVNY